MTNCDEMVTRLTNTVGPWRGGKFLPLILRPHSVNTYALSKVWFKCSSVDLRVKDTKAITSSIKSWLYADQFEKPADCVTYRPTVRGGLGLQHVESKAQALLVRSFMETAANPSFINNVYHQALYRWHVLEDNLIPNPGRPPYYSVGMFQLIKHAKSLNMCVSTMSTSEWYRLILEKDVTMEEEETGQRQYIPCRVEKYRPELDWDWSWSLARQKGLNSDQLTFLWQMMHDLLPTQSRLHRISPHTATSPACIMCEEGAEGSLSHELVSCDYVAEVGEWLINCLRVNLGLPQLTAVQLVTLDLPEMIDSSSLPAVWLVSHTLAIVWRHRAEKKLVRLNKKRAELEAQVTLLRETKYSNAAEILNLWINCATQAQI